MTDEPKELNELLKSIGAWQKATFTNRPVLENGWRDPSYTFYHLTSSDMGEIWELGQALEAKNQKMVEEELADCLILLLGIANLTNVDIYQAVNEKMKINRSRIWDKPNKIGIIRHKSEEI